MTALFLFILFLFSFLFTLFPTRFLIGVLRRKKVGQCILEIGPAWHKPKEGTPTMGGIVFLFVIPAFAVLGSFLLEGRLPTSLLFLLVFAAANGLIGVVDDSTKLKNKQNQGLLPWQKLFLQSFFVGCFLYLIYRFSEDTLLFFIPFTNIRITETLPLVFVFFILLLGNLNCVNLSDGIDGLTSSCSLILGLFFLAEGLLYRDGTLIALGASLAGCMLGFLVFNKNPARIFMGDTGSLFLGALLSGAAFLTHNPATLPIYSFIFLLEGLSVILQVLCFKRTGKRLFRMAPLHHHLEKCGWNEKKIVLVFSFITLLSALFAHFALL